MSGAAAVSGDEAPACALLGPAPLGSDTAVIPVPSWAAWAAGKGLERTAGAALASPGFSLLDLRWPNAGSVRLQGKRDLEPIRLQRGQQAARRRITLHYPELALCTDNGAMIALAAAMRWQRGVADARAAESFVVRPRWPLGSP